MVHKGENGTTTLASSRKRIGGVWYLVFEATEFSPYALVADLLSSYDASAGLPYWLDGESRMFIGFAANGRYIAPTGKTVRTAENPKRFTDVSGHWAEESIRFVTERELFLGTAENVFSPDEGMTRAMFAAVIGRLYERSYGELEPMTAEAFSDCDYTDYYGKYVVWAEKNGIIGSHGDGRFGPRDQVTREQMAAILHRFADFLGALPPASDAALLYPDAALISGYAREAALYCQSTGIIAGREGGAFSPNNLATRAEVASILQRFVESVVK